MTRRFTIPAPPPAVPAADAFVKMFDHNLPHMSDEEKARIRALYEWAYKEAEAANEPSIFERDLLGLWN